MNALHEERIGEHGKIYYTPEEAKHELMKRRRDPLLLKAVLDVVGELPRGFAENEPCSVLSRHVATAKMEDVEFVSEMTRIGVTPSWIEYPHDLFTSANPDKNTLWKLFVFKGYSKKGNERSERYCIIPDPCAWERKRICDLVTPWGENLVAFHHRLRHLVFPQHVAGNIMNASCWFERHGGRASLYYKAYLSLFVAHGILCEDFEEFPDQPSNYPEFRKNVFLPSLEWVFERFGIGPIIVRLPWRKHLDWYHPDIEQVLKKNGTP